MTVQEKTEKLMNQILCCDLQSEVGIKEAKSYIRLTLKIQDRDTRHACSDSVIVGGFWNDAADSYVVRQDWACNQIMNTTGGLINS